MFRAFLISLLLASPVTAQNQCQERDIVVGFLTEKYGERLHEFGLQATGSLIEIWISSDTGTFTVLLTGASGTSCIVASGQDWQSVTLRPGGSNL